MVCSLLLMGTPFLSAQTQTPSPCAKQVRACCRHGGEMPCCKANSSPDSQSKPAIPAPAGNQIQLSVPPQNIASWVLPDAALPDFSPAASTLFSVPGTALYKRDCALLI